MKKNWVVARYVYGGVGDVVYRCSSLGAAAKKLAQLAEEEDRERMMGMDDGQGPNEYVAFQETDEEEVVDSSGMWLLRRLARMK